MKFQQDMKGRRKQQKNVHKHCTQMLIDAERKAERDSITKIEAYKKIEKHAYRKIERERKENPDQRPFPGHEEIESDLDTKIQELQAELMDIEMKLQDALLNSRKLFFSKIKAIIDEMAQLNQNYNADVLNEVNQFNEKFREAVIAEHEKFMNSFFKAEKEGSEVVDAWIEDQKEQFGEEYVNILGTDFAEPDSLMTALEGFKEAVELKVVNFESTINNAIKVDWQATETSITTNQHSRNRDII